MAEAIAALALLSSIAQVVDFGTRVVKRLDEFRTNVSGLPESFQHMSNRLPLLVAVVEILHRRTAEGDFDSKTQQDLDRIIRAVQRELEDLDALLRNVLPSARASTWEKGLKAVKSVKAQKSAEHYASTTQEYC